MLISSRVDQVGVEGSIAIRPNVSYVSKHTLCEAVLLQAESSWSHCPDGRQPTYQHPPTTFESTDLTIPPTVWLVAQAIKLTVNELLLSILESFLPGARLWTLELFAGGGGGFSQVVFTNPVEIVKVRLQTQPHNGSRPKSTLEVIKELGLRGLYSGSIVTIARDVPSSALFFAAYVALKELYPDLLFVDGCLAAIPATLLVTPLDAIKTRLQVRGGCHSGGIGGQHAWDMCVEGRFRATVDEKKRNGILF